MVELDGAFQGTDIEAVEMSRFERSPSAISLCFTSI